MENSAEVMNHAQLTDANQPLLEQVETSSQYDVEIMDAVRRQIEYYFSKENLQNDKYLASQMDAQMSVPIAVIMKFAKLKALTADEELVKAALADSSVTILGDRLKANVKHGRSTIILRDIPTEASEEEVREVFSFPDCKPLLSVRSDIGNTWFVVMETEEDAKDTVIALRVNKRTFRGAAVKARVKTETVRSYFPAVAPAPMFMGVPFMPPSMDAMMMPYFMPPPIMEPIAAEEVEPSTSEEVTPKQTAAAPRAEHKDSSNRDRDSKERRGGDRKSDRDRERAPRRDGAAGAGTSSRPPRAPTTAASVVASTPPKEVKTEVTASKPPIEVNSMTFPRLGGAEDRPIPSPGYKGAFQKYSFDEIISIVKSVKEASLPADLKPKDHQLAMMPEINMDLLKRQRTFTIDETREQLRLGRPVQREAIISGAVDYRSMMYGDSEQVIKAKEESKEQAPAIIKPTAVAAAVVSADAVPAAAVSRESTSSPPTVPAATAASPPSPARISAASWAAMVRSSALSPVPEVPSPVKTPAPAPRPAAAPVSRSAGKDSKDKERESRDSRDKDGRRRKDREPREPRERGEPRETKAAASAAAPAAPAAVEHAEHARKEQHEVKATESTLSANAPTWGGKTSFANVLKLAGTDEPILAAPKPAAPAVAAERPREHAKDGKASSRSSNGTAHASHSSGTSRTAAPATTAPVVGNRSRTSSKDKRSHAADSDGMWVKETLPALHDK